jgi:hypothetical protein
MLEKSNGWSLGSARASDDIVPKWEIGIGQSESEVSGYLSPVFFVRADSKM